MWGNILEFSSEISIFSLILLIILTIIAVIFLGIVLWQGLTGVLEIASYELHVGDSGYWFGPILLNLLMGVLFLISSLAFLLFYSIVHVPIGFILYWLTDFKFIYCYIFVLVVHLLILLFMHIWDTCMNKWEKLKTNKHDNNSKTL